MTSASLGQAQMLVAFLREQHKWNKNEISVREAEAR